MKDVSRLISFYGLLCLVFGFLILFDIFGLSSSFNQFILAVNSIVAVVLYKIYGKYDSAGLLHYLKEYSLVKAVTRFASGYGLIPFFKKTIYRYVFPLVALWFVRNTLQVFFLGIDGVLNRIVSGVVAFLFYVLFQKKIESSGVVFGQLTLGRELISTTVGVVSSVFIWTQFVGSYTQALWWPSLIILVGGFIAYTIWRSIESDFSGSWFATISAKLFLFILLLSFLWAGWQTGLQWIDDHTIEKIQYEKVEKFDEKDYQEEIILDTNADLDKEITTKTILDNTDDGVTTPFLDTILQDSAEEDVSNLKIKQNLDNL